MYARGMLYKSRAHCGKALVTMAFGCSSIKQHDVGHDTIFYVTGDVATLFPFAQHVKRAQTYVVRKLKFGFSRLATRPFGNLRLSVSVGITGLLGRE